LCCLSTATELLGQFVFTVLKDVIVLYSINLLWCIPLPSKRQHQSFDDCLEVMRKNNQNCSVLCCVRQLCAVICTQKS